MNRYCLQIFRRSFSEYKKIDWYANKLSSYEKYEFNNEDETEIKIKNYENKNDIKYTSHDEKNWYGKMLFSHDAK
tara:strand:+ start:163 stop:387 length:225 start_codon:yes stop_codon:yes gene_type:complete